MSHGLQANEGCESAAGQWRHEALRNNSEDTLVLFSNDYVGIRNPKTREQIGATQAPFPIQTSPEGVLRYFYKGERKYFAVTSFEKLKPLAYP